MVVANTSTQTKVAVKPMAAKRVGSDATYGLSVLPKANQPEEKGVKAEPEAYINLTGLFDKTYKGSTDISYQGKNTSVDEDTGVSTTFVYGLFSLKDKTPAEAMVLKSKPFIQPDGPRTPNVSTEKWKQIAVMTGKIKNGLQSYHGTNENGDVFFINTRKPR